MSASRHGTREIPLMAIHFFQSIRNAAIHAAFAAAATGTDITMESAVQGVAHELRKMGRLLKDKDFGEYHALVSD